MRTRRHETIAYIHRGRKLVCLGYFRHPSISLKCNHTQLRKSAARVTLLIWLFSPTSLSPPCVRKRGEGGASFIGLSDAGNAIISRLLYKHKTTPDSEGYPILYTARPAASLLQLRRNFKSKLITCTLNFIYNVHLI